MKKIEVVAAVIKKDEKILATQRGYGEFEGGWLEANVEIVRHLKNM